jgi:inhibitor of cysteine peptidase
VSVKAGDTFQVTLEENPSTGYAWNVSVTSGLNVINSTYLPSNTTLAGVPGLRQWQIMAEGTGDQKFSAVYVRPNATAIGNETTFVLNVNVTALMLGMLP